MAHLIARNVRVEVGATKGSPLTISAITKANPGVASSTAHGLSNGEVVVLAVAGMVELDGQIVRIANQTTDSFELEGIDTTSFGTFVSGSATEVATWQTLAKAQTLEAGSVSAERRDAMVLLDTERQYVFGASDVPEVTCNGLSDLNSASVKIVAAAAKVNGIVDFRVTFNGQSESRLFRGYVTRPGESISVDQLVTSSFSVTQVRERLAYSS